MGAESGSRVVLPRPHGFQWRAWIHATRPPTLSAAVVPVVVGTAAATQLNHVKVAVFIAALFASVFIQIGTNLANDAFDFWSSADSDRRLGPRRLIQGGVASARQVFIVACVSFVAAAVIGLYLISVAGWPILVLGVLSITAALAYTGGPWPLGYHGLGDVFVFVFFGLVGVLGSAYLQIKTLSTLALVCAIPVGLLVNNILVVNNLRDIETDRAAGKNTLAVRLGRNRTRVQYVASAALAFGVVTTLGDTRLGIWSWLPVLTLPLAARAAMRVVFSRDAAGLNKALKQTGLVHLFFGLLLAAALWLR